MSHRTDHNQVIRNGIPQALSDLGGIASGDSIKAWILNSENAQASDWGFTPPNTKYPEGRLRFTESFTLISVRLKKEGKIFTPAWGWLSNDPSLSAPQGSPKVPKRTAEASPKTKTTNPISETLPTPPLTLEPQPQPISEDNTPALTPEPQPTLTPQPISEDNTPEPQHEEQDAPLVDDLNPISETPPTPQVVVEPQPTLEAVDPQTPDPIEPVVEAEPVVEVEPEVEVEDTTTISEVVVPTLNPLDDFDFVGATDDQYGYIASSLNSPIIRFPKSTDGWENLDPKHKAILDKAASTGINQYAKIIDRVASVTSKATSHSSNLGCFGSNSDNPFCSQCPLAPLCKRSTSL